MVQAAQEGIISGEVESLALKAERAVYGDKSGQSIFQTNENIDGSEEAQERMARILAAQISKGGVIDPVRKIHLPDDFAIEYGLVTSEILGQVRNGQAGIYDNGKTYSEMLKECEVEDGVYLLKVSERSSKPDITGEAPKVVEPIVTAEKPVKRYINGWVEYADLDDLADAGIVAPDLAQEIYEKRVDDRRLQETTAFQEALFGYQPITGIYDTVSGKYMDLIEAQKENYITENCMRQLFEAQAATGRMIDPETGDKHSVNDFTKLGKLSSDLKKDCLVAENACLGFPVTGEKSEARESLLDQVQKRNFDRNRAFRFWDAQIATGGVIDCNRNLHLTDKYALQFGMIDKESLDDIRYIDNEDKNWQYEFPDNRSKYTYFKLLNEHCQLKNDMKFLKVDGKILEPEPAPQPERTRDSISFSNGWGGRATLASLFETGCIDAGRTKKLCKNELSETDPELLADLSPWLFGLSPIAGIILDNGEKISLYEAQKRGILEKGTVTSLLEAQAATGAILDPTKNTRSEQRFTVKEAAVKGLIDKGQKAILARSENAVLGFQVKNNMNVTRRRLERKITKKMNLFEAIQGDYVVKDHGMRMLEAQLATGGLIDVNRGHRIPTAWALQQDLIDQATKQSIEDPDDDTQGFTNPNTNQNQDYKSMLAECVWDQETQLRLLAYHSVDAPVDPRSIVITSIEGKMITLDDIIAAGVVSVSSLNSLRINNPNFEADLQAIRTKAEERISGYKPIAGIYDMNGKRELTIQEALEKKVISRSFALDLIEAQAACGTMIDMKGKKIMTFEKAKQEGLYGSLS